MVEAPAEVVGLGGFGFRRRAARRKFVTGSRTTGKGCRCAAPTGLPHTRSRTVIVPGLEGETGVREDVVELDLLAVRRDELHRRVSRHRAARRSRCRWRVSESAGARCTTCRRRAWIVPELPVAAVRRVAVLVELAREEGRANSDGGDELVFKELPRDTRGRTACSSAIEKRSRPRMMSPSAA